MTGAWLNEQEIIRDRIRSFHRERVRVITDDALPWSLSDKSRLIVHLIPIRSVTELVSFPAAELKAHGSHIDPLGTQHGQGRFNADGYFTWSGAKKKIREFSQLLRDGRFEGVMCPVTYDDGGVKLLRHRSCEDAILNAMRQYLTFCKNIGLNPPIWLCATLTACQGAQIDLRYAGYSEYSIDRPDVQLPDFEIASLDDDPTVALRPICDALWNAVGFARSGNYTEAGQRLNR